MEKKNQKPEKALKLVEEGEACEVLGVKAKTEEKKEIKIKEVEEESPKVLEEKGGEVAILKEEEKTFTKIRSNDSLASVVAREDLVFEEFEDGWSRSGARKKSSWTWLGGLFACVVMIGSLVIWAVLHLSQGAGNHYRQREQQAIVEGKQREQLIKDSQEAITAIKTGTRKFLAAQDTEEIKDYIDMPDRVSVLVDKYYQKHEWQGQEAKVGELQPITIGLSSYWMVHFSGELKNGLLLMAEKKDGYKVDWESFVCYNPMTLADLIDYKDEIKEPFRLYARIDSLYSYELTEEQYQCFRLTTLGEDTYIWGYLKRGTDAWEKFYRAASKDASLFSETGRPMMLEIERPDHEARDNYFIIKDFVSSNWVYPRKGAL